MGRQHGVYKLNPAPVRPCLCRIDVRPPIYVRHEKPDYRQPVNKLHGQSIQYFPKQDDAYAKARGGVRVSADNTPLRGDISTGSGRQLPGGDNSGSEQKDEDGDKRLPAQSGELTV